MAAKNWTTNDIPEQDGRLVVITGANSGIGYEAALALAGKGARVVLAVRSLEKGQSAIDAIRRVQPQATLELQQLDLADLSSVRRFAEQFHARYNALGLLINNAGIMGIPYRRTIDGFEVQFGTNHLGHFALTGLLLPALLAAPAARIVTVSSMAHAPGRIDFDNLDGARRYQPMVAYSQSKLANLLFAYELQRRLAASSTELISVACHPGWSETNLQTVGPRMAGAKLNERLMHLGNQLFAQSPAMGALPTLYAATAAGVQGGDYIGPRRLIGGYPVKVSSNSRSHDREVARRLWQLSEQLTGVTHELAASPPAALNA